MTTTKKGEGKKESVAAHTPGPERNKDWWSFHLIILGHHPDYSTASDRIRNAYEFLDVVARDFARSKAFLIAEPPSEIHPDRAASAIRNVKETIARDAARVRLIAAAPETAAERDALKEINKDLLAALIKIRDIAEADQSWTGRYQSEAAAVLDAAILRAQGVK